jgi:transketolase
MRKEFATALLREAKKNKDIILVTADLGYLVWDQFKKELPEQYINVGAAEMAGATISVGLALEGKIPVFYSITPFLLYRPFEVLRNYINHESIPVILIGSGRGNDYEHDGFSHYAGDDKAVLKLFPRIQAFWPKLQGEIPDLLHSVIEKKRPAYINLARN